MLQEGQWKAHPASEYVWLPFHICARPESRSSIRCLKQQSCSSFVLLCIARQRTMTERQTPFPPGGYGPISFHAKARTCGAVFLFSAVRCMLCACINALTYTLSPHPLLPPHLYIFYVSYSLTATQPKLKRGRRVRWCRQCIRASPANV